MATKNDVTGDSIQSKIPSKEYSDNWDRIFGKKENKEKENDDTLSDRDSQLG